MSTTAFASPATPVPVVSPAPPPRLRRPHRILMTTDAIGGAWTYSLDLCRELNHHGIEVILATMGPPPEDDQRQQVMDLPGVHLVESSFRLEWMDNPADDLDHA